MSELIETGAPDRKDVLKRLILDLHAGTTPDVVQRQLVRLLGQVPYGLVVEVEQELVEDGMPPEEVTRLCHLHSAALSGAIDTSLARRPPPGHPAQVLSAENAALLREAGALLHLCGRIEALADGDDAGPDLLSARVRVNALADVEKHYQRKEHLLFPFLEAHGITAPPQVMWGKHDEARALLRGALAALAGASGAGGGTPPQAGGGAEPLRAGTSRQPREAGDARSRAPRSGGGAPASPARRGGGAASDVISALRPLAEAIRDMVDKEEKILLPMCLDVLEEREWWDIARQSDELGWCLVEPEAEWRPAGVAVDEAAAGAGKVRLPTGTLAHAQLEAILGALPLDATFVDAEDRVRWFSHGKDRVFSRSRAVLGRKVQLCHPPSSVGTVERILDGFKAGTHDTAAFWIQHRERFVHIEYRALRGADGGYLGCLEVTQDLTEKRALQGEQRLLAWQAPAAAEPAQALAADGHGCAHATAGGPTAAAPGPRPAWVEAVRVVSTLDARPLLATGAHPVGQVMAALGGLAEGEAFVLVTPFVPGPLLEKAQAIGCVAHSEAGAAGEFRTWFGRVGEA